MISFLHTGKGVRKTDNVCNECIGKQVTWCDL